MPRRGNVVSLKRPDGTWGGMDDRSTMVDQNAARLGVTWQELRNVYHSRDGTEIRRLPGSRVGGKPFLGQYYDIQTTASGATSAVDITPTAGTTHGDNYLSPAGTDRVYVTGSSDFTTGVFTAIRTDENTVTITSASADTSVGDGSIFLRRGYRVHALAHVDGRPVVVAETRLYRYDVDAINGVAKLNVGCWVGGTELSFASPAVPDFTTAAGLENTANTGFHFYPTTTLENTTTAGATGVGDATPTSYPQNYDIKRKMTCDVMNSRLFIAVPGTLCLFEVDLRFAPPKYLLRPGSRTGFSGAPDHRWTKALGIPKGVLFPGVHNTEDATSFDLTAGDYQFSVAYMDPFSREVGLHSEVLFATLGASGATKAIRYVPPRGALAECVGLSAVLYATEVGTPTGSVPFAYLLNPARDIANDQELIRHDGAGGEVQSWLDAATTPHLFLLDVQPDSTAQLALARWPEVEQMHPGAGWVRVCRGRLFAGGAYPDTVSFQYQADDLNGSTLGSNTTNVVGITGGTPSSGADPIDNAIKRNAISNAYSSGGQAQTFNVTDGESVGAEGLRSGTFVNKLNAGRIGGTVARAHTFEIDFIADLPSSASQQDGFLRLRPNLISVSEEGFPGVAPGQNWLEVDAINGTRSTGAARIGDTLLLFTERSTEQYTWAAQPRKQSSITLSHMYGCISPSSIVEGPFGAAWLSAEGPCIFDGQVRYVGEAIREFWKTLVVQDDGLMQFAMGTVDLERDLVIWAVRRNSFVAVYDTDDSDRSKSPCDTLILWSFKTGNFSIARLSNDGSGDSQYVALNYMPYDRVSEKDARWRVSFMLDDPNLGSGLNDEMWSIYGWEESANDRIEVPAQMIATQGPTYHSSGQSLLFTDSGTTTTNLLVTANDRCYVRSPDGEHIKFFGKTGAASTNAFELEGLEETDRTTGADWDVGDVLEIGIIPTYMKTQRVRYSDPAFRTVISGVNLWVDLVPPENSSSVAVTQYAYARVKLVETDGTEHNMGDGYWGDKITDGINRFDTNRVNAHDFQVIIEVVSNGSVNIKDITVEMG